MTELIYCAGKNPAFEAIAAAIGFRIGVQLPNSVSHPVFFADQDWKTPQRRRYMAALARHRPQMVTVLDLETEEQITTVLDWAEEAAQWCAHVVIIPKCAGVTAMLPRRIGTATIVLGYSVPTRYGGTEVPIWEFAGWPIHLLGGSPRNQMHAYRHLSAIADVVSLDGNYHQMKATRYCQYWQDGRWLADNYATAIDVPATCFTRSCRNLMAAWHTLIGI